MSKATVVEVSGARERIAITVEGATSELEARRAAYERVYGTDPEEPPTQATIEQYTRIARIAAEI